MVARRASQNTTLWLRATIGFRPSPKWTISPSIHGANTIGDNGDLARIELQPFRSVHVRQKLAEILECSVERSRDPSPFRNLVSMSWTRAMAPFAGIVGLGHSTR